MYRPARGGCAVSAPPCERAATEPEEREEIEITEEMIEAGVRSYNGRDSRFMMDRDIVVDIFMSMLEARPKSWVDKL